MPPHDDPRYGRPSRWPALAVGLPIAVFMTLAGAYLTLVSWGVIGDEQSKGLSILGPLVAGIGVALGFVCLRPRQ
ncbi:hypothetical protein L615_005700000140 [Nocardioides sp. J9]|uniref:hypothetical protein n=1 Tax=unclassified Nocardioides TaxID=2615069 RepID=UPI00048ED6BB|nr:MULTISPECIES: hypothetical protein [unclassified Nocardioides]TWG94203.1 hypothetical protein L615_005700000140 [Nocardioides sp. J9]